MSGSAPATTDVTGPDVADIIARVATGRAMLERLAVIGMRIVEEIGERAVNSPYHPEVKHEPGRAFAHVSRAIRLTIVLVGRLDKDILALRNGTVVANKAAFCGEPTPAAVAKVSTRAARDKVSDTVRDVIIRELGDVEKAQDAIDRVHERLIEGEDYDALLRGPWRACVEAICADLGLFPDWSLWSDETGFPIETPPRHHWPSACSHDPANVEHRRRRRAERPPAGSRVAEPLVTEAVREAEQRDASMVLKPAAQD